MILFFRNRFARDLFVGLLLLGCSLKAEAALVLYEGFDAGATDGTLVGKFGATSFGFDAASSWNQGVTGTNNYLASGLIFGSGATELKTIGGAYSVAIANSRISRPLDINITGTVWGSALVHRPGAAAGSDEVMNLMVLTNPDGGDNDATRQILFAAKDYGSTLGGMRGRGFNETYNAGTAIANGQTHMILFKVTNLGAGVDGSSVYKTWILESGQFDAFKASGGEITEAELDAATLGSGAGNVLQRGSRTGNYSVGDFPKITSAEFLRVFSYQNSPYIIDEFRFAAGEAGLGEVTPLAVPEPASCLLLLMGIAGVAGFRLSKAKNRTR